MKQFFDPDLECVHPVQTPKDPSVAFIEAGVRAAQNSVPTVRSQILSDITDVLDCAPNALDFLFYQDAEDSSNIFDFPDDTRRALLLAS